MQYTIKSLGFYGPCSFDQKTLTNFNFRKKAFWKIIIQMDNIQLHVLCLSNTFLW